VDGELSDWDDDSGDEFSKPGKQAVTNVRDRTISLSNVYTGRILSLKAGAQEIGSASKWFSKRNLAK